MAAEMMTLLAIDGMTVGNPMKLRTNGPRSAGLALHGWRSTFVHPDVRMADVSAEPPAGRRSWPKSDRHRTRSAEKQSPVSA